MNNVGTKISTGLILIFAVLVCMSCNVQDRTTSPPQAEEKTMVDSLMEIMTLQEKIGQLNMPAAGDVTTGLANNTGVIARVREGNVGAILNLRGIDKIHATQKIAVEESRLGIPLIFALDVIHGHKTIFPVPLGLTSTWNMDMIEKTARIAAEEASAEGIALTFSPMIDLSRDPRWGRIVEGPGEDPYLGGRFAKAMVEGYQQDDLSRNNTLMSCAKHLALYGAPVAGRDYNTVDMSRLTMFNVYFPPFKAAIEANVGSMMAAFNDVDDIPATENEWLLTKVLRNRWGFEGFVVSDYTGVTEMIAHGVGEDAKAVAAQALSAGLDMDMVSEAMVSTLEQAVEEGLVSESQIDQACRRILEAKVKLGLFENPYQYGDMEKAERVLFSKEHRDYAREVAAESFVLLKNEDNLLPLEKNGTIGVIGPLGNNRENMTGTWSVAADFEKSVSLLDGLKNAVGDEVELLFARGSNIYRDPELEARVSVFGKPTYRDDRPEEVILNEALSVADSSDVIIAALGEAAEMSGESSSRTDINIPEVQRDLLKELVKTGKPVILVLFTGRPLTISWAKENVPAILNVWFGGSETGNAIADVLFGEVNPSAKLPVTFPRNIGQVPIYYSAKSTGRPITDEWFQKFKTNYLDVPNTPLYPFGYGLSYSKFEYGDIRLSKREASGQDTVTASVEISNSSDVDGKEVVQLYIHDVIASTARPNKELKAFEKITIPAGETREVSFQVTPEMFKFYKYDPESGYESIIEVWEAGEFDIMIGTNSAEVKTERIKWMKE